VTERKSLLARFGLAPSSARSTGRRSHVSLPVALALTVSLAACGAAENSAAERSTTPAAEDPVELTMSIVSENVAFLPAYVAISEGIYEKNGVNVSLTNSQSGAAVVQTVLGGGAPLGAAGADTILNATTAGAAPTTIIANLSDVPTSLVTFSTALLEKHSLSVADFKKLTPAEKLKLLEGEKVATFGPGGLVDKMITEMLTASGLSPDSITRVTLQGSAQVAGLKAGQVVAAVVSPPGPLVAEADGYAVVAGRVGDFSPLLERIAYDSIFVQEEYAEAHEEELKKFGAALAEACTLSREGDPQDLATGLLEAGFFTGQEVDMLAMSIEDAQLAFPSNCLVSEESMENLATFAGEGSAADVSGLYTNDYLPVG
jgi:NitT/TauT family transport system substrate-binding protein